MQYFIGDKLGNHYGSFIYDISKQNRDLVKRSNLGSDINILL